MVVGKKAASTAWREVSQRSPDVLPRFWHHGNFPCLILRSYLSHLTIQSCMKRYYQKPDIRLVIALCNSLAPCSIGKCGHNIIECYTSLVKKNQPKFSTN